MVVSELGMETQDILIIPSAGEEGWGDPGLLLLAPHGSTRALKLMMKP